ncbi:unnamed protein product [Pleuronectes platessa]|uniref:Uncharacterized protein n=1 Tax=Pleuronectes platessa TaxID=8262 RepID=A0A9N7W1D5_PLEPL|nr:unnamed protein product [Pleuronectes platessa]
MELLLCFTPQSPGGERGAQRDRQQDEAPQAEPIRPPQNTIRPDPYATVHHLPKASTVPYRTGSVSDPAVKPSVHPGRSGSDQYGQAGWRLWPLWSPTLTGIMDQLSGHSGLIVPAA